MDARENVHVRQYYQVNVHADDARRYVDGYENDGSHHEYA